MEPIKIDPISKIENSSVLLDGMISLYVMYNDLLTPMETMMYGLIAQTQVNRRG